MDNIFRLVKGFIIGASMLVPGVSGGTMAIVLNSYDEMIHSANNITKNGNIFKLFYYGVGAIAGVFLLSNLVLTLINTYSGPVLCFFAGTVVGSFPSLYRKAGKGGLRGLNPLFCILGVILGTALVFVPISQDFEISWTLGERWILLLVVGLFVSVAFILPGISTSYILLLFGFYSSTLMAIKTLDFTFLGPLILGVIIGCILTLGLLERAMNRHPGATYMLILGFMIGSLIQVLPHRLPVLWNEALLWTVSALAGFVMILVLGNRKFTT